MTIRRLILPIVALLLSLAPPAAAQLLELLPADLRPGLTPAERTVLELAPMGREMDFRVGNKEKDDPANADKWDSRRIIRAEFLYWFCTDEKATKLVHSKGIWISGARIEGELDFEGAELPKVLRLDICAIPQGVVLLHAKVRIVSFQRCHVGAIFADGLKVDGCIFLRGTLAKGEVRLVGAEIGGDLICDGASFENPGSNAFSADGLTVKGAVSLNNVHSKGKVRLSCADIGGQLACTGAAFEDSGGVAFNADGLTVRRGVFLSNVHSKGEARLLGAEIGGSFDCDGASFENPGSDAFSADRLTVKGTVFLSNVHSKGKVFLSGVDIGGQLACTGAAFEDSGGDAFNTNGLTVKGSVFLPNVHSKGEIRLLSAEIGGDLVCDSASFENASGNAFYADNLTVKGDVLLRNVHSKGEVRLLDAEIGGQLACSTAAFENPIGDAFSADGMTVKGAVFLNNVHSKGKVRLSGAEIGSQLACTGAAFEDSGGVAFNADGLTVKGSVFLYNVRSKGEVRLLGAKIGGDLACDSASFENPSGHAFIAERLRVESRLFLSGLTALKGSVDLLGAHVGTLLDDTTSWPKEGELHLDGFEYGVFRGDETLISAKERLRWIRLQPPKPFHPQPYEQLAAVFRRMGYETEAQKVLIAKQDDLRKYGDLPLFSKCWKWLLSWTISYGYHPEQAWRPFLFLLLLGWGIFCLAARHGILRPTGEKTPVSPDKHPILFSFAYSLDVLLPVVNLHQKNGWFPDRSKPCGLWITLYFWIHIALGWLFSALLVAALTGLVHTD